MLMYAYYADSNIGHLKIYESCNAQRTKNTGVLSVTPPPHVGGSVTYTVRLPAVNQNLSHFERFVSILFWDPMG